VVVSWAHQQGAPTCTTRTPNTCLSTLSRSSRFPCPPYPPPSPLFPGQVLEYIPMTNYPLFINLLTTFVYIPVRCVCVC
jgi:hypothetical protein